MVIAIHNALIYVPSTLGEGAGLMCLVRPAQPEEAPVHSNSETSPTFLHPGSHWDMCTNQYCGVSTSRKIVVITFNG